jgi:PKD repeat protein
MYRNTTASPPSGGYADDNSTVSLLHFDGANAATAPWVDETGKIWYNTWGWSNLSTANYKFGTASLLNPAGSGIGYTIPAPVLKSDFNLSTGDFTYDAWVYPVASPGTAYAAVLSTVNTTGDGYLFGIGGTVNPQALVILGNASGVSATYDAVSPNGAVPYNQWSHVAYVRSGNNLLLFANGTLLSTTPITASYKYNAYNKAVLIGASLTDVPTAWNYNGYVDESRLSKGIARWTTSFTPPTYQYETTNAAFVYTIVNIYGPLPVSVQFNDTTPDSNWTQNAFYWDFGDGSTSTLQNPTHTYSTPGTKTVVLQTFNNYMTSTTTQNIGLGIPLADFIGAPTSSTAAPVVVQFTDLTENLTPITWNWSFGDGTYSNDQNPVHAYSWGIFDVNETATSVQGSSYKFKHNYIQVSASQVPAQNTWWTPHTVQITVMDLFGARLYNVNVNATYNQSSMPTAWITELYGIQGTPAGDMVNRTLMMSGSTGSDGTITFTMLGSLKYDFTLQSTTYGLNANRSLFPSDSMVNFYLSTAGQQLPTGTNNTYTSLNGTRVYFTEPNASYGSMCIDYIDTSGNTAYVNESWWFTNNLSIFNWANFTPGTTLSTHCYTMKNVKGTTTWWQYSAGRVT